MDLDPDPEDSTYLVDYAYLLREPDGSVEVVHDRHVEGLFARAEWLRFLSDAGFKPRAVLFDHSELEPGSYRFRVSKALTLGRAASAKEAKRAEPSRSLAESGDTRRAVSHHQQGRPGQLNEAAA